MGATFNLTGYQPLIYSSRDKGARLNPNIGGGIGLYIREGITFEKLPEHSIFKRGLYESLWICLKLPKNKQIIIGNIYRPNSYPAANEPKAIAQHLEILHNIKVDKKLNKAKLIVCSDFNVDLLTNGLNANTTNYLEGHFINGLIPVITKSAHITQTSSKVIDHIFVNNLETGFKSGIIETELSDHMPTFFSDPSILSNIIESPQPSPLINKVTIPPYLKLLKQIIFLDSDDPASSFDNFFNQITAAGNLAFPLTTSKFSKRKTQHKPWMSAGLLRCCREKNKLLSTKVKYPSLANTQAFKNYSKILVKCKKFSKQQYFLNAFEEARRDLTKTWVLIGEVTGRVKIKPKLSKTFLVNGTKTHDKNAIAKGFNEFFSSIGPELANKIPNPKPGTDFTQYLGQQTSCVFSLTPISMETLLRHIKELKPKTSAGSDLLSNNLIKLAVPSLAKPLLKLINLSLSTGYVPPQMTVAKVIPLFKDGSKELFNNYRPIAIISSVGKLLERVVSEKLTSYLESNELLSNHQYGFRSQHSISHPLLQFSKMIFDSLNMNKFNLSIFIDLKKAFDTVNLDILIFKLSHYGILGKELQFFINYLKRSQQVFTGEALSEVVSMLMGIAQGSCLGPILFILFINDLPNALQLFCQLFADDTTLQTDSPDIQTLFKTASAELVKAENWLRCNKLTLYLKKQLNMQFSATI